MLSIVHAIDKAIGRKPRSKDGHQTAMYASRVLKVPYNQVLKILKEGDEASWKPGR